MQLTISKKPKLVLASEGPHLAKVKSVVARPNGRCAIDFIIQEQGEERVATKEYSPKLEPGTELWKDVQTLRGQAFNDLELGQAFDLSVLVDRPCRVTVVHRKRSGGALYAAVALVQKAAEPATPPPLPAHPPFN